MIISRKKYDEAVRKAVEKATERIFDRQYYDERFRTVHERIDDLERRMRVVENPRWSVEDFGPCYVDPQVPLPKY